MKKNIIFCTLAVSWLWYAGCYNTVQLSRQDFKMNEQSDITVVTKDGQKYEFAEGQYQVRGDSLYPIGVLKIGTQTFIIDARYSGAIPLSDIVSMETKELDTWRTVSLVAVLAAIGLTVAAGAAAGSTFR